MVYTDGYDGHCLRAYSYHKDSMPDITLASDSTKCFKAKVGNSVVFFKEDDTILYKGKRYTGQELYDKIFRKKNT